MTTLRVLMPMHFLRGIGLDDVSTDPFVVDVTEPTPLNTGPRYTPTVSVSGDVTLSTGQVYAGRHVTGGRVIVPQSATGTIVIEDCVIDASEAVVSSQKAVIEVHPNTSATVIIRFNELIGTTGMLGIGTRRFVAYRNHIHHVEDAIRLHTFGGTGTALDVEIYANMMGPLLLVTPDPYNTRTDNKTHSDVIQIEGGTGANIHGNALHGYKTTDGTSNVGWVLSASPYTPALEGAEGASDHPQALSCVMLTPTVSAMTGLKLNNNWMYGGEIAVNGGSSNNSTSTGEINGNRFSRDQWFATWTIGLDATATGVTTSGNVYMDDGSPVTVRRNA